jgi:hypothetical protein
MARTKKESRPGIGARNGHKGANGRGRRPTAAPARRAAGPAATGGEVGAFQKELRAAREQALRETRDGYQQLGKELTASAGRLAESVRHAQEQLAAIVRQAREARRDVEELREAARDARREAIGEQATGDRAGAADGGHGTRRAPRAEGRTEGRGKVRKATRGEPQNRLGVTVGSGVVVAEIQSDSPAESAGLKKGDVIEHVNGTPILSATHLRDAVRKAGDNSEVTFRIVRGGEPDELKARTGKAGDDRNGNGGRNELGVTVGPGVVVAEVLPNTPASKAGLERGDVIDDINGTAVQSGEQLRDVVQRLPGGSDTTVRVMRAGKAKELKARLDAMAG